MRASRWVLWMVGILAVTISAGCGKSHSAKHSSGQDAPSAALAPTPDTTPVEALRTPAGLVLKGGPEPTPTPLPAVVGGPAGAAKSSP